MNCSGVLGNGCLRSISSCFLFCHAQAGHSTDHSIKVHCIAAATAAARTAIQLLSLSLSNVEWWLISPIISDLISVTRKNAFWFNCQVKWPLLQLVEDPGASSSRDVENQWWADCSLWTLARIRSTGTPYYISTYLISVMINSINFLPAYCCLITYGPELLILQAESTLSYLIVMTGMKILLH